MSTLLNGTRILLVEDDPLILMDLQYNLSEAGAEIVGACQNVKAALALTSTEELHIAVLDLQLGRDSVVPLTKDLAQRGIPFIFYTGQVDLALVRTLWPHCVVIQKPASLRTLAAAISDVIARTAARPS